jgi:predicted peptidase
MAPQAAHRRVTRIVVRLLGVLAAALLTSCGPRAADNPSMSGPMLRPLVPLGTAASPETRARFVRGFTFHEVDHAGQRYPFAVYVPRGHDAATPGAALVFLHGRGECGTDGSKMLAVGLPAALMWEPHRWPFVVLIPQKPDPESQWEDHAGAVLAMLDAVIASGLVDAGRVAITGLSQGGHGTLALAAAHPDRFRAAVPVCGYLNPLRTPTGYGPTAPEDPIVGGLAAGLVGTPVWLFHGGRDDIVPASETTIIADAINARGGTATTTVFPEANHNAWDPAYRGMGVELSAWLIERTR